MSAKSQWYNPENRVWSLSLSQPLHLEAGDLLPITGGKRGTSQELLGLTMDHCAATGYYAPCPEHVILCQA